MQTLQNREAKAIFSVLVAYGARLYPLDMPNLANYLMALPEAPPFERETTSLRGIDFE